MVLIFVVIPEENWPIVDVDAKWHHINYSHHNLNGIQLEDNDLYKWFPSFFGVILSELKKNKHNYVLHLC